MPEDHAGPSPIPSSRTQPTSLASFHQPPFQRRSSPPASLSPTEGQPPSRSSTPAFPASTPPQPLEISATFNSSSEAAVQDAYSNPFSDDAQPPAHLPKASGLLLHQVPLQIQDRRPSLFFFPQLQSATSVLPQIHHPLPPRSATTRNRLSPPASISAHHLPYPQPNFSLFPANTASSSSSHSVLQNRKTPPHLHPPNPPFHSSPSAEIVFSSVPPLQPRLPAIRKPAKPVFISDLVASSRAAAGPTFHLSSTHQPPSLCKISHRRPF